MAAIRYPVEYELRPTRLAAGEQWVWLDLKNLSEEPMVGLTVRLIPKDASRISVEEPDNYVPVLPPSQKEEMGFELQAKGSTEAYVAVTGEWDGAPFRWESPYVQLTVGGTVAEIASRAESFDFTTGARVHCRDGDAGTLRMVVADPHTRRITDLIVEKGHRQEQDRVLPVSIVERTTDEDIYLSINSEALVEYPRYREAEMTAPVTDWTGRHYRVENVRYRLSPYGSVVSDAMVPLIRYQVQEGIPATVETLERGTPVYGEDGRIGRVDHILTDGETGAIRHLVVQHRTTGNYAVVPADLIERLQDVGITVAASAEEIATMPRYQPRARQDTLAELRDSLAVAPTRDVGDPTVDLEGGVARLTGVAPDAGARDRAERLARSVEGVIDVDNALDVDPAIAERVSAALRDDPRTRTASIDVDSKLGVVTLQGPIRDKVTREAAKEIARQQDGVVAVRDQLEIHIDVDQDAETGSPRSGVEL